ncbi:MAG: RNB domain-containing ribonuclease [Betaproteobacteria bacterium]|nr:RNB domain-containing ribonuclease [Betaproteobacteria bacterium]
MNIFYEEDGGFKVGVILADNDTSLQVEAPHGKRSKVKASAVLLRFDQPAPANFMADTQRMAADIDVDFLWECCGEPEFDYTALAREYFGHDPSALESAAVLVRLHGAPMYFYKKGRGRYKAAPQAALQAALAGIERKKQQALQKDRYVAQLAEGKLPPEFTPLVKTLLYKPDKNSIEYKALEEACETLRYSPVRLLERCGAITSTHDFHLDRFLFEYLPRGEAHAGIPPPADTHELALADVAAYSIDDASTTEIDDAFSVSTRAAGGVRIGIHIAAPALGITLDTPAEALARERLSTVYHPAGKITMLPPALIDTYTLAQGRECPALSLYVEVNASGEIAATETRVERVRVAGNLRHDTLEPVFHEAAIARGAIDHPQSRELMALWDFAKARMKTRLGGNPPPQQRAEYNFHVANDRVTITPRLRGSAIDIVVSELMIYVNSTWGRELADKKIAAIYRVQSAGKVRMSTAPAPHEGLNVAQYLWASSPLRRYVDLINQRQLIAAVRNETAPYQPRDAMLLAAMRDFELAYDAYAEFQRNMERYWCLRWLTQESRTLAQATVLRENLVRFDELPLVQRVASLPELAPDTTVELEVSAIDLLDLSLHCEFRRKVDGGIA